MSVQRGCSKTGCGRPAMATLTYAHADKAVVLGPLATYAEPHTYDLCRVHAERLTPPRGWNIVRIVADYPDPADEPDDLLALADAVRETRTVRRTTLPTADTSPGPGRPASAAPSAAAAAAAAATSAAAREATSGVIESRRRGHLRVLRDGDPIT